MLPDSRGEITRNLEAGQAGDADALHTAVKLVHDELVAIARKQLAGERTGHSWDTADLIQEAMLKLTADGIWQKAPNSRYLFRAFSMAMRRLLIDHARERRRQKRGAGAKLLPLDAIVEGFEQKNRLDLLELDDCIEKLAQAEERSAAVVVMVYFGGHTQEEIAEALGVSVSTVQGDLRFAKAFLHNSMKG